MMTAPRVVAMTLMLRVALRCFIHALLAVLAAVLFVTAARTGTSRMFALTFFGHFKILKLEDETTINALCEWR
jgi:hypothetical protein